METGIDRFTERLVEEEIAEAPGLSWRYVLFPSKHPDSPKVTSRFAEGLLSFILMLVGGAMGSFALVALALLYPKALWGLSVSLPLAFNHLFLARVQMFKHIRKGRKNLRANLENPMERKRLFADHLHKLVEQNREELLGTGSSFSEIKSRLERALEEAKVSCDHWQARKSQEPADLQILERLHLAGALKQRFSEALESLKRQQETFLEFLRHCEAQVSKLEISAGDYFEEERLARLSNQADDLTRSSGMAVYNLATAFIQNAQHLQKTLIQANSAVVAGLVESASVEDLEELASRVVSFESSNTRELKRLEAAM